MPASLARLDDLNQHTPYPVKAGEISIVLVRQGDEVFAVEDQCSHIAAPLSAGRVQGDRIACPLHGSLFCLRSGTALTPPATQPIRCYPLRIENGQIFLA